MLDLKYSLVIEATSEANSLASTRPRWRGLPVLVTRSRTASTRLVGA